MKKIFTLALLVFSLNGFSQTIQRMDKQTQIVKRDCEVIVITTDSLVATNMRSLPQLVEQVSCFSSYHRSTALMFWFSIDSDKIVQDNLNNFIVELD